MNFTCLYVYLRNGQTDYKIYMEMKMTQTIQNNIKKKKKVVKLPLHDFKTHSLECYTVKTV